jgi:hypothetical protein
MKRFLILIPFLSLLSLQAQAQDGKNPFCDQVNAKRQFCAQARVDCSFMMGDLDPATLDKIDQIKSCPSYLATLSTETPEDPDITKLVCCLASGQ